ncbi:MAG: chromate resistance protein [Thermomicrobiales bacterium]
MKWVTRSGVRMDRAAMVWLIKKMVDPEAEIVILPEAEVMEYAEESGATPFHHPKAEMRNTGTRTGFDAVRTTYELNDPALGLLALIIRGAETNDRSLTQWSPGFWAIGSGLRLQIEDDMEYVAAVGALLDGLYRFCQDQLSPVAKPARQ